MYEAEIGRGCAGAGRERKRARERGRDEGPIPLLRSAPKLCPFVCSLACVTLVKNTDPQYAQPGAATQGGTVARRLCRQPSAIAGEGLAAISLALAGLLS
jgi:hypothetical protein